MTYSIDTVELPALVGIDPDTNRIDVIRPIHSAEMGNIENARALFSVVSPIMTMFAILDGNYQDILKFTTALASGYRGPPPANLSANRYLLNYIASASALLDHFSKTYKRQCRLKDIPDTGFKELRRHLEQTDDVFQFFVHFRDFVLHVALPVGNLTVTDSKGSGRSMSITYRSADLRQDEHGRLSSCRLLSKYDNIDLILHLGQFHRLLTTRIFDQIVQCFLENLKAASRFHKTLAEEVRSRSPTLHPHLLTNRIQVGIDFTWTFDVLPEDLISQLGIEIGRKPHVQ